MPELGQAAELRAAAKLIRERAQAATPGPWQPREHGGDWLVTSLPFGQVATGLHDEPGASELLLIERDRQDAEHIASWHPAVALAVADWLDAVAEQAERPGSLEQHVHLHHSLSPGPLAVARAYLGKGESR